MKNKEIIEKVLKEILKHTALYEKPKEDKFGNFVFKIKEEEFERQIKSTIQKILLLLEEEIKIKIDRRIKRLKGIDIISELLDNGKMFDEREYLKILIKEYEELKRELFEGILK